MGLSVIKNKIAWGISIIMILSAVLLFFTLLPYVIVFNAYNKPDKTTEIECLKKAYKYSIFNYQKVYTAEALLADLIIKRDYKTAVEYIEDLEKAKANKTSTIDYFASYAYRELQDYEKALNYAKLSGRKQMQISIYIRKHNFEQAEELMGNYAKESSSYKNYHYDKDKAEIEFLKGNYDSAEKYINNALSKKINFLEVYNLKSKISNALGNKEEAKVFEEKAKDIETKLYKGF